MTAGPYYFDPVTRQRKQKYPSGTVGPPGPAGIDGNDGATGPAGADGLNGALAFVGSVSVTGSPATTMGITGLDLSSDNIYVGRIDIPNPSATVEYRLFYNGDSVTTNYSYSQFFVSGGTRSSASVNGSRFTYATSGASSVCWFIIIPDADGYPRAFSFIQYSSVTAPIWLIISHAWRTASNVTSIDITADTASKLLVGASLQLWKMILE